MPPKRPKSEPPPPPQDPKTLPSPSLSNRDLRMSYRIARGEQGVLTFEPYKSVLLPYWRFRTVPIAEESSAQLWAAFRHYVGAGDFVGADMSRKFIQMGMTRAKRYANHKGGRKYERKAGVKGEEGRVVGKDGKGVEKAKGEDWEGREEKLKASEVFRAVWKKCTADEDYAKLKGEFLEEQKLWDREQKKVKMENVKDEYEDEMIDVKEETDEG